MNSSIFSPDNDIDENDDYDIDGNHDELNDGG